MHKPPDKPCESCEHAPCQLPLNCGRWLDYLSAKRQYMSDMATLRQIRLSKRYDLDTASDLEWQRRLAEACPWRQEESNGVPARAQRSGSCGERTSTGMSELSAPAGSEGYGGCEDVSKKIDYEQVRTLYDQGLSDPAIAEQMGISRYPVCQWRKKNGLPPNGPDGRPKAAEAAPQADAPAEVASEAPPEWDVSDRIRQLLALVRPEDSDEARNLTARLAGQWILDSLSATCTETCNKTGCAAHK